MEIGTTHHRDQDPGVDVVQVTVRLKHLTYDAREVVERSRRPDDLTLYWQVMLIQNCYNYGVNRMAKVLGPQKAKKDRDPVFTNEEPLSLMMERGLPVWVTKDPIHRVEFSKKAIWNLYQVDSLVLVSDFGVRLERLVELLGKISQESIEEIAVDTGRSTMPIFLSEMEQFFASVEESARDLKEARAAEVTPQTRVDPVHLAVAEKALEDLRMMGEMEKKSRS